MKVKVKVKQRAQFGMSPGTTYNGVLVYPNYGRDMMTFLYTKITVVPLGSLSVGPNGVRPMSCKVTSRNKPFFGG